MEVYERIERGRNAKNLTGLTPDDIKFLITCLEYSQKSFRETAYPTYELKQNRLGEVDVMLDRMRRLRRS